MKKKVKIIIISIALIIILSLLIFVSIYYSHPKYCNDLQSENISMTKKAIVVKVNPKHLDVMGFEGNTDLYRVSYEKEENIKFKEGQEILIYYTGGILETFPAQITNTEKIEIIEEEKIHEIPKNILQFYNSSKENVKITISEFTGSFISLTIVDKNELPYNYPNSYVIRKKVKNKDYTGIGYKIGQDTENSTSGFTRSRT